ncbi:MAG: beta-glucuronidase [Bacteroidales bacterium]|nr:beta-glucuronidase [Bacteroidales bacterium]MCD8394341.1 beta-glucuronidase [Bacteroidales bacterium]
MKRFLLAGAIALCAMSASAQEGRILHNVYARDVTSLNGTWQTIVDPIETGYYDYRMNETPNGFFRNQQPQSGYDHVEYDFCDAETLQVPGDWNTQRPELMLYEGTVWYKRDLHFHGDPSKPHYLYFAAVNYHADVYLNGEKLGTHEGGFTPFNFDVTGRLNEGDNTLIVRVNNTRHAHDIPTIISDWWNYGGITRDVLLVSTPEVSVDDYSIKLAPEKYNEIEISAKLSQPLEGQRVTISIPELKINRQLITDAQGQATVTVKAKPELWSPESPRLYDVEVACGDETLRDRIGFRHIAVEGKTIKLNGQPVFFRGISIHEEAPFEGKRVTAKAECDTLLQWAKELNCNFVRLAHYPHNEYMVRRAEELGLMVWSEIPVYWTIDWENPATLANAQAQLRDNINRDHNRCAIVVWSIANETPHKPARDQFLAALARQVKEADQERLLSMAMEITSEKDDVAHISDNMHQWVDIVSFNAYLGWYGGTPESCDARNYDIPYDKPFFVSEFGAGAVAGLHGDATQKWTEEYQADLYQRTLAMYDRQDGWAGCSPWILKDFRSPRRQNHQTQNFFNRKGLVSDRGQRKLAFAVLRDFYATRNSF